MKKTKKHYTPSDRDKMQVNVMVTAGIQLTIIAKILGISFPTLRKHYKDTIDTAKARANASVAAALFKSATEKGNVTAQIFWLKTQAGWHETVTYENKKETQKEVAEEISKKFASIKPPKLKVI